MKQLKFMLAAATAISLATAAQAEDFNGSANFEFADSEYKVGDTFPKADGEAGWTAPTDNDSTIAEVTGFGDDKNASGAHTKGLSVSTAGGTLLRNIDTADNGSVVPQSLVSGQIYIDTMVQFTPTATGSEPVAGSDDKLMIYAQDVTVGDATETHLFVVAANVMCDEERGQVSCETVHKDTGCVVSKDTWYRLTVKASAREVTAESFEGSKYINVFEVYLDGSVNPVESSEFLLNGVANTKKSYFPSIQGVTDTAKISTVGFAGEGMVDDLVMTTDNPFVSTVDFTLTLGDGVSSVTWTIGEGDTITATKSYTGVVAGTYKITDVQYADWYTADGDYKIGSNVVVTDDGNVTVGAKLKTATDIVVNNPGGASEATVNKALVWAKNAEFTTAQVAGAANLVANYLLNVADLAVEPKIEIVEVNPATSEAPMTIKVNVTDAKGSTFEKVIVGDGAATDLNAVIKYRAAATLEALKTADLKEAIGADDKFVQVVVE